MSEKQLLAEYIKKPTSKDIQLIDLDSFFKALNKKTFIKYTNYHLYLMKFRPRAFEFLWDMLQFHVEECRLR